MRSAACASPLSPLPALLLLLLLLQQTQGILLLLPRRAGLRLLPAAVTLSSCRLGQSREAGDGA